MATRTKIVLSCDRCGSETDVRQVIVGLPAPSTKAGFRKITLDVCEPCETTVPLAEWIARIPERPGRVTRAVVSPDFVENGAAKLAE